MAILVFCAGATQPELSVLRHLQPDVLVGVDGGAARLVAAGFQPDWAIGDFDSAEPPRECRQILRLPPEKDDTDLEAALIHILRDYAPDEVSHIVILGALGDGRLDHLLANIWLANQPRFAAWLPKMQFVERRNTVRFYLSGSHEITHEIGKKYLSFIGLTPIECLTLAQVKYPVTQRDYPQAIALISNEFIQDTAYFSLKQGVLCVIQSMD